MLFAKVSSGLPRSLILLSGCEVKHYLSLSLCIRNEHTKHMSYLCLHHHRIQAYRIRVTGLVDHAN